VAQTGFKKNLLQKSSFIPTLIVSDYPKMHHTKQKIPPTPSGTCASLRSVISFPEFFSQLALVPVTCKTAFAKKNYLANTTYYWHLSKIRVLILSNMLA